MFFIYELLWIVYLRIIRQYEAGKCKDEMEVCREQLLSNISMYSNVRYLYFDSGYHCCKNIETNSLNKFKTNLSVESPETAYTNQRMVKSSFN